MARSGSKNSCSFEHFQSGKIDSCFQSIDGHDLPMLNISYLREHMSLVSQEPVLFDRTIWENIVYGLDKVPSDENIENAAKIANIHDFVINLPQVFIGISALHIAQLCITEKWYRCITGPSYNCGWSFKIACDC